MQFDLSAGVKAQALKQARQQATQDAKSTAALFAAVSSHAQASVKKSHNTFAHLALWHALLHGPKHGVVININGMFAQLAPCLPNVIELQADHRCCYDLECTKVLSTAGAGGLVCMHAKLLNLACCMFGTILHVLSAQGLIHD